MGESACIKRMVAVRTYSPNTKMEKYKQGKVGGLRIKNLVLISLETLSPTFGFANLKHVKQQYSEKRYSIKSFTVYTQ